MIKGDIPVGIYIHVPFCASKCPYCDFYSITLSDGNLVDRYVDAVVKQINRWTKSLSKSQLTANTVYFGGGTPSLLSAEQITRILQAINFCFTLVNAEITMEVNPGDIKALKPTLRAFYAMGGNRVSIGMQSGNDEHLALLGRRHNFYEVEQTVALAKECGIENISLDIMLATQNQTIADVVDSVTKAHNLGSSHVSVYLLSIEKGTPFYSKMEEMNLPDDDQSAELYLAAGDVLDAFGYVHYEISNFCLPRFESCHNLKYWTGQPYLGIGPSAHSFLGDKRFYFNQNVEEFISEVEMNGYCEPILDEGESFIKSGSIEEYIMLRLRLGEGLTEKGFVEKFKRPIPPEIRAKCSQLPPEFIVVDEHFISLTRKGFLLSNSIISFILN